MKSRHLFRLLGSNGKPVRLACSLSVLGCLALLLPIPTFAGGVVTNCTEADLRAAMAGGGTVTFASDGTITQASTITILADTRLGGSGHSVTITGPRAFYVTSNTSFTVLGLTISNCQATAGAGIYNDRGIVNLGSVVFQRNSAFGSFGAMNLQGGAIYSLGGQVNATNCLFAGNAAVDFHQDGAGTAGGAIYSGGSALYLQQCVFNGNSVFAGGGYSPSYTPGGSAAGGAIYSAGPCTLEGCTFISNLVFGGGGSCGDCGSVPDGRPGTAGGSGAGGAIYNSGALTVSYSLFASNSAYGGNGGSGGSGTHLGSGPPAGAAASGTGGAVCSQGSFTLANCTFVSNFASGGPGGMGGPGGVYDNGVGGAGSSGGSGLGGAVAGGGVLVNCTLASNSARGGNGGAGGSGGSSGACGAGGGGFGAIYDQSGSLSLINCTIVSNSATFGMGGGGGCSNGRAAGGVGASGTRLVNTLLATNLPGGNCSGSLIDLGYNLSSDSTCYFANTSSKNNTDPIIGPLADNSGPTFTITLLPGSPAIDGGDTAAAPAADQRGFPRPAGSAADIGAYEYGSMVPVLNIARSGPGLFDVLVKGNSNQWCRLLASSNLSSWAPIATNQIGPDGSFHFSCDGSARRSFYRVVMP